jgi:hypothetical protein
MAWRQRHPVDVGRIPRRHDQPARVGALADHLDQLGDLVDRGAVRRRP